MWRFSPSDRVVPNSLLGSWANDERTSKYWEALCPPHFGFHRLPHNLCLRFVFGFCLPKQMAHGSRPAHPAVGSCKTHRTHCELESSCPVCFGSCKLQHLVLDGRKISRHTLSHLSHEKKKRPYFP